MAFITSAGGSIAPLQAGATSAGATAGLGALLSNPITAVIASIFLPNILEGVFGGGNTLGEKALRQQLQYSQSVLPIMQRQAQGQPSLATQMAIRSANQEINRLQQSLAATAQRNVPAKTTIGKSEQVGQQRYQTAKAQTYGNILAQQQLASQQALLGLAPYATQQQLAWELQERQDRGRAIFGLTQIASEYKQGQANAEFKKIFDDRMRLLFDMLLRQGGIQPPQEIIPSGTLPTGTTVNDGWWG